MLSKIGLWCLSDLALFKILTDPKSMTREITSDTNAGMVYMELVLVLAHNSIFDNLSFHCR